MFAIRDAWRRLSTPTDPKELSAEHVPRTNAWVFNDHRGSFGLMLTGVDPPGRETRLKNIHVAFKPEKEVQEHGSTRPVPRCLEVHLDSSCAGDALAAVFERLSDKRPQGAYTTEDLLDVLAEGVEVFRATTPPSSKEAVIGAWGELHLLEIVVANARSPEAQAEAVRAWEAEGPRRDVLEFRFQTARAAIEVKTTLGVGCIASRGSARSASLLITQRRSWPACALRSLGVGRADRRSISPKVSERPITAQEWTMNGSMSFSMLS